MSTALESQPSGEPAIAEILAGGDRATPPASQDLTASEIPSLRTSHWGLARLAQANRQAERFGAEILAAFADGRSPELDPRRGERLSAMAVRAGWGGAR